MDTSAGVRRTLIAPLVAALAAACSSPGQAVPSGGVIASLAASGSPAESALASHAVSASAASPDASSGATVLEDAGIDVNLPPGTYTSRVFEPVIEFELEEGWIRSEATEERLFRLRTAVLTGALAVSHVDFAQCGEALLERPRARDVAELIASMSNLSPGDPATLETGDRTAIVVNLPGAGPQEPEGGFPNPAKTGCILTAGDEPFPAEGHWAVFGPGLPARVALVDVGDLTIAFTARSVAATLAEVGDMAEAVLVTTRFPGSPPED